LSASNPMKETDMKTIDGIPRRNRLDHNVPAELAIRAAVDAVEKLGASPVLTDAVNLLGHALAKVADFVDRDSGTPKP